MNYTSEMYQVTTIRYDIKSAPSENLKDIVSMINEINTKRVILFATNMTKGSQQI
jgi:hypothetical protein